MKKKCLILLIVTALFYTGCKKDKTVEKQTITKSSVKGLIQKGPFINGTTINIFELDESLAPTGKVYTTQIVDNSGLFEIKNISLISQYVLLKADGYYFNEITGNNSNSPITLYSLTDILDKVNINVNIITNLEKSRVEYLIGHGLTFSNAKKQAQNEILKIFSINKSDIIESELLDITKEGDNNAILLAISAIIQGYRTESEMSELIANIITDIREDGLLNSSSLRTSLINDAKLLKFSQIRANIINRYANLGITVTIPNFEKYITIFLDSTDYTFTKFITYPSISNSVPNILADSSFIVQPGLLYPMAAYLPKGTSIKILCKPSVGYDMGAFLSGGNLIGYTLDSFLPDSLVYHAIGEDKIVNVESLFGESPPVVATSIDFVIYENNSTIPTRIITRSTF